LGELDVEEAIAVSFGSDGALRAAWGRAFRDVLFRGWLRALGPTPRPKELLGLPSELDGEGSTPGPGAGEEDNEPALKGWKETEVRLW
jgi:hypothetical protein